MFSLCSNVLASGGTCGQPRSPLGIRRGCFTPSATPPAVPGACAPLQASRVRFAQILTRSVLARLRLAVLRCGLRSGP